MAETNISLTSAASYVCLDSNIILECKPLATLPWDKLGVALPLVIVVVPQVLKEVDAKKQDGRIGQRAREFNRLLVQVTAQSGCMRLPGQSLDVYIAIGRPRRIDWTKYGDEDPDDGDTRLVLEILNLMDVADDKVVFVSNDVKPLWIAQRYGAKTQHAGEDWLRPIEPSPHDKEMQRLKQRNADLETSQPKLTLDITAEVAGFKRYAVPPLSPAAREDVIGGLRARHPRPQSPTASRLLSQLEKMAILQDDETVTPEAHQEFENRLPEFVERLPRYLEQQHGQFPFSVTVKNTGPLRAQHLILTVTCSSGWLNDRPVLMPIMGPAPKVKRRHALPLWSSSVPVRKPGRHEMHLKDPPDRSTSMRVQCEDFPAGDTWTFEGYACIDPRAAQPLSIRAQITAANLHGMIKEERLPVFEATAADARELVELKTLKPKIDAQSSLEIRQRFQEQRYEDVELDSTED